MILITLPVFNEEKIIEKNVEIIRNFLIETFHDNTQIIIADNGSTDLTPEKSKKLSEKYSDIRYVYIYEKGRGRALRNALSKSNADVLSYMDIDISTNLEAFPKLIKAIEDGYDIAIGSRFVKGSHVSRSIKRELLSRGYNILLKLFFDISFNDSQCGFKAVNRRIVEEIIPKVKDNAWFFDTELLIKAEKKGFKIKEIPVYWTENKDSKVNIIKTIVDYMRSIFRLYIEQLR